MSDGLTDSVASTARPGAAGQLRANIAICLELGKWRLSALVVTTTAVGYALAVPPGTPWTRLLYTVMGTALAALGANALNEWWEVARDERMLRTRRRPLPTRGLSAPAALAFGLTSGLAGPLVLIGGVGLAPGLLALATLLIYVLVYTPIKVRSPLNTLVGAVVGAIPPTIGWVAATGRMGIGAWILAGILFVWQVPHFLALAWLHRADYARGGFLMVPVIDVGGHFTTYLVLLYSLTLLPLTLMLTGVGVTGWVYAGGAIVLWAGLLAAGVALERQRSTKAARRLFLASVIYLPVLLALMLLDRAGGEV
jgi:protoheme IX farnesyltransferase